MTTTGVCVFHASASVGAFFIGGIQMNNTQNQYDEPELNILEKLFFQFYSEQISELPESKEHKNALKDETEKMAIFMNAMDSECRKKYFEYESARNRVESHLQYQSFLLGIKFAEEMKKILKANEQNIHNFKR